MALSADRLLDQLERDALAPNYFLFGAEPLQLTECSDALRARARREGITERLAFDADSSADWAAAQSEANAMSLFAERRLIHIHLGSRKPDKSGQVALEALLTRPGDDDILLITAGKLDGNSRKARWFKLLDKNAVCVQTYDLKSAQLPGWLARRARRVGKKLADDAARLIADRVEGNLLAAAQEVEKLGLLCEGDTITSREVMSAVTDSARYDVFQLTDAVLAGDLKRALRMLRGLRDEGTEPVVVNWALGRELRQLAQMGAAVSSGRRIDQVCEQFRVWSSRRNLTESCLRRHDGDDLMALLAYANRLDTVIKGGRQGAPWDELEILILRICGAAGAHLLASA